VRSTIAIDVGAPPELVFRLAHDVERWPRVLPHYMAVHVLARGDSGTLIARFVARRELLPALGLGLPVAWRSRTWNDPSTLRLRFVHLGGATDGMDVTWRIERRDGGCRVSIDHDFQPRFSPWASMVERLFIRPIAGRTLATFKAIAEAVATDEPVSISPKTIPQRERDVPEIDTMKSAHIDRR
jgi:ribosome-associated toxin RatA of RatAB toxin-antitoxin module